MTQQTLREEYEKKFDTFRVGVMYTRIFDDNDREKYHDVKRSSFNQDDVFDFFLARFKEFAEKELIGADEETVIIRAAFPVVDNDAQAKNALRNEQRKILSEKLK